MLGGRVIELLWKLFLFLLGLTIVSYVLIEFRIWSSDFTLYFIRIGNWEMILFITVIVTGVTIVLTKMLQWETKTIAKPRGKR